jgi:methylisocitrate lyase
MSLRAQLQGALPVTAPLVLNPLMARMVEAAGFPAGYLGGGASGYAKVALEANLNLTEMCQAALDIRAVSSLPLILDGACGYGDPMHMHGRGGRLRGHRDRGPARPQARPPSRRHRAHDPDRADGGRASDMDDALRRGEAYRRAGADLVLLSMAHRPEQLRAIAERLGGPLMYLAGRGGLAGSGLTLKDLGGLGYKIVADPSTPLLAAFVAWKKVYADLAQDFGSAQPKTDWSPVEHEMLKVIDIEKLLAVERATVEKGEA